MNMFESKSQTRITEYYGVLNKGAKVNELLLFEVNRPVDMERSEFFSENFRLNHKMVTESSFVWNLTTKERIKDRKTDLTIQLTDEEIRIFEYLIAEEIVV